MKGKLLLMVLVIGVVLLAALAGQGALRAESGGESPQVVNEPEVVEKSEFERLIEALRAAGLEVEIVGAAEDGFFGGAGHVIEVNGLQLTVYEFESEAAAIEGAGTVSAGGTIIGTAVVDWIEPPHFYQAGALLALYAGSDEAILAGLQDALGEPFVVGVGMGWPPAGGPAEG